MKKRLCRDCKHLKRKQVGIISSVHWCGLVGNGYDGTSIGVNPWMNKPHPKCPLKKEPLTEVNRSSGKEKIL